MFGDCLMLVDTLKHVELNSHSLDSAVSVLPTPGGPARSRMTPFPKVPSFEHLAGR